MSVTVTIDRVGDVLKAISELGRDRAMVGIPSSKAGRDDGPINNAALGYIHEHGAPEAGIPARPFLVPGAQSVREKCAERLKAGAQSALSGNADATDKALHAVGLIGQNAVRAKIQDGPFDALEDGTLADRRRRGRTGDKPLIDTGQLRNAITYVIRRKGS